MGFSGYMREVEPHIEKAILLSSPQLQQVFTVHHFFREVARVQVRPPTLTCKELLLGGSERQL